MHDVTAAVASWLLAAFLVQLVLVLGYCSASRRREAGSAPARLPRFGVVLPVRGLEPGLAEALRSVLAQDYPSFELHVVVDGRDDPAWPVVARTVDGSKDARLHALETRRPTCSLVCSSLLQALDALGPECELIAFAAADLVAPRDWLRQLASGMRDETVGGTLGNRWYVPVEGRWGSLVRQQWNAGAAVLMRLLEIPWAGGLALRREDVDALGLRAVWERSLVEDVSAVRSLRAAGRRFRFLPGLLVANRDEIDLPAAYRFIARQLL
jgi:cellulose synthase/poly-beta-1,6-N-acetylglucosamine synthase-like glycosyltransferase